MLQVQDVFTNVARGLVASKHDLLRGFDTTDKEVLGNLNYDSPR